MFNPKKYKHQWYLDNRERHKSKCDDRKFRERRDNRLKIIAYLKEHPCVDCGEVDIVVLQFDHVAGTKTSSVSHMVSSGYSWETILKEIEKCEVRCANDHLRRTSKQFNHYKSSKGVSFSA